VQSSRVVEADVVLKQVFPMLEWARVDTIPEFLLNGALHAFHLPVEAGSPGSYPCMPDAQSLEKVAQLAAELRTVVRLDAAQREGERLEKAGEGPTDSGHRPLFQNSGT
jgi:hypothetical protein